MSIVVTGATGHLGRLIVEALLDNGIPAEDIVATGRAVDRLDDLATRGVVIRRADYSDPAGLASAFAGADKVMLVSGSEVGSRREQHRNAVDAAVTTGAGLIVYTSIAGADHTELLLADEHRATEAMIRDSGVPFAFLRNGWYLETYTAQIDAALDNGVIIGAAGDGLISGAARADYAAAAAAVAGRRRPNRGELRARRRRAVHHDGVRRRTLPAERPTGQLPEPLDRRVHLGVDRFRGTRAGGLGVRGRRRRGGQGRTARDVRRSVQADRPPDHAVAGRHRGCPGG